MKKPLLIIITTAIIFLFSGFFLPQEKDDYTEKWKDVEQFVEDGLPRSALKIVDQIYVKAKKEGNEPEILKSLINHISLQSQFEEKHLEKAIQFYESELKSGSLQQKQLLHSMLAEMYHWYYQQNRWQINDRGVVIDPVKSGIDSWDAVKFNKTIKYHYLRSLSDQEKLKSIDLASYQIILQNADSSGYMLRPSLFDLLANRALSYFESSDAGLAELGKTISKNLNTLLSPANEFVKIKLNEADSSSSIQTVIGLYQYLLHYHLESGNKTALVDTDLKRLDYILNHTDRSELVLENYLATLNSLKNDYYKDPVCVQIAIRLAKQHIQLGKKYNPELGEKFKDEFLKAEQICKDVIDRFPDHKQTVLCRNILDEINKVEFGFQLEKAVYPEKPILSFISFRNTNKLHFKVVRVNPDDFVKSQLQRDRVEKIKSYLENPTVHKWMAKLPENDDHQEYSTEIIFPALESGLYLVFASAASNFEEEDLVYQSLWVSPLSYISRQNPEDGSITVFVADRESGFPEADVNITAFEKRYNPRIRSNEYIHAGDFKTDKTGFAKLDFKDKVQNNSVSFKLEKECAPLYAESDDYIYISKPKIRTQTKTYLFTDRAIYRPGQTVYFKGIVIDKTGEELELKRDYSAEIEFRNVNRKVISSLKLTTNEFGSFQGSFVIPKGGLNGQMAIKTKNGSVRFLVEEYKRPTYKVLFDTVQGEYQLGDTVKVTGIAENFSGNSVMNAKVSYRVVRSELIMPYYDVYRSYRPYPYHQPTEIDNGTVYTNEDGLFIINFKAEPGYQLYTGSKIPYRYTIHADATDVTGEVQNASTGVTIGQQPIILEFEMDEKVQKEKTNGISIVTNNLAGARINTNVTISLFRLDVPVKLYVERYWAKPVLYSVEKEEFIESFPNLPYQDENNPEKWNRKLIYSQKINIPGETTILKETLNNADPGKYLVLATAITEKGDTVSKRRYFSLFSEKAKEIPGKTPVWFHLSKNRAEPGETILLAVGSSARKAKVFYEIVNGDEIIASDLIQVSRGQKFVEIPVLEKYRGNFSVNINLIKHNRRFSKSFIVEVPFTNKELKVELLTHRDQLTPGKKEEWRVKISGPNGNKIAAELMAGMYDASLDQFNANSWYLSLYSSKNNRSSWKTGYFNAAWSNSLFPKRPMPVEVKPQLYPEINWFGYQHYNIRPPLYRSDIMLQKASPAEGGIDELIVEESNNQNDTSEDKDFETLPDEEPQMDLIPIRTNFNETAFFFPQMKTDSSGNVIFKFSTPDALTEWRLMMLAHSDDLKVGSMVKNIKASKELMIIPNLPRFVRQGDRLVFAAKVINYTDREINPEINIEFFNPLNNDRVNLFADKDRITENIVIGPKQSKPVSWEIMIPYDLDLLAYRITARSGNITDGEERLLPVLTNRMLVTETMPMPVNGNETKSFSFDDLVISDKIMAVSTRSNYRYTVEFTSNPAWYAIQALPYLSTPETENPGNLFRRYYANALSSFIINSNSKIQAVFKSWRNLTPETFYSNLQKNEELKNVLLEATPWVLESESETEQKRRIGLLFDLNKLANDKETAIVKLRARQMQNGAWPWFKGMKADRHTTQNIVLGVGKLLAKGVIDLSEEREIYLMISKAIKFLDDKILEDYNKLKKNHPKGMDKKHISNFQVEYLYARSLLFEIFPLPAKSETAFNFYLKQSKQYWLKESNSLQAMIALTINRFGHRNEAEGIIRSLKERALHNDEMGMYWRSEISWRWYEAPVETQAVLIEAFDQVTNDRKSVEKMKIWLLKQKQTTKWSTSGGTAEAIYALLLTGKDLLSEDKLVELKIGEQQIIPKLIEGMKLEHGTGYFKKSWKGKEIKAPMGKIEVSNPNSSIAWGAAYWQYFENLDRIKGHDTPLSIEKQMFIEELTDDGAKLKLLPEGHKLATGDKLIIRLLISSDRNLEYIHLNDMRAAALEPMDQLSGYSYKGGLGFYKNMKDVSTEFFIQYMKKGTYVMEYPLMVTQKGEFSNGIATIQSYYAPEFAAHSEGKRLVVR